MFEMKLREKEQQQYWYQNQQLFYSSQQQQAIANMISTGGCKIDEFFLLGLM